MKQALLLMFLALAHVGCDGLGDMTVQREYATLSDARKDDLFGRGWLPDILPPTAHRIRTTNDLDHNTSFGGFSLAARDAGVFYASLSPGAPDESRLNDWSNTVDGYTGQGFSAWSYHAEDSTWAFFCSPTNSECEYFLW